jgi:S-DNA-T family DNA segregation ATPase FtsK/SpoIIIE
MTSDDLIGKVVARYLRHNIPQDKDASTARYLLDSLSAEQTASIAKAIVSDAVLAAQIEIKLPHHWVGGLGLPEDCLTTERATYYRNSPCVKPMLLTATRGDDERQSLADLTPIDSNQIRAHVELWIDVAAHGLPLVDDHLRWWQVALTALQEVAPVSLDWFAQYILATRERIEDGKTLPEALGEALPALHWPRNPGLFRSLSDKVLGRASKWRSLYTHVSKKQACYLKKKNPKDQTLSSDEIAGAFERVRDQIPHELHPTIETFIAAAPKWNAEAEALANLEWETIAPIFDGLQRETFNLGRETLKFYDERKPDFQLTEAEVDYLTSLEQRGRVSQPLDDDVEFYNQHRGELKEHAPVKSRWDRLVFGSPVETKDFLLGLALCFESLFDQDLFGAKRKLVISTERKAKKDLRNVNVDAGLYFAFRYRSLKDLLPGGTFDVGALFQFEALAEAWAKEPKYKPNRSTARKAIEIKFYVSLLVDGEESSHRQLIWRFEPESIASELCGDWADRLSTHPFLFGSVERQTVASKGGLQAIDLRNVRSLGARPGQDRGALVPSYKRDRDLILQWYANLEEAKVKGALTGAVGDVLANHFDTFAKNYIAAVSNFPKQGVLCPDIETQFDSFGSLLDVICRHAKGDRNRELLLKPILSIGVVPVRGGVAAAIVAPWNPLRMRAMAVKARRFAGLVKHLLTTENVLFGDAKLFFKELREAEQHPHYPEIVLGWRERKPELLALNDSFLDYSLHELPIGDDSNGADTNDNPAESAGQIVEMIRRYLSLFPHEKAKLSAVLYNCDSAGLPQAVVSKINDLHEDDDDMRCEVILRHRNRKQLHALYESIVESADSGADSFVASEASRDFMARLRIGIMADQAPVPDAKDGPQADLVFLHDVISRHARVEWYRENSAPVPVEELVPSHWSRRRPSPIDEEKSIVYLCCPVQSQVGWCYITAMTSFFKGDWDEDPNRRYLPARQLDFNDPETADIFYETHNLGNWVVNYDELLDRRQLLNQNVRVIRYKQSATQGRNMLVSSRASLGLLHAMLFNRIKDLVPDIADNDARALAQKFIEDANQISGDIVLRAAKRGKNASELLGLVLSSYLVRHELGVSHKLGWYFLDDYAEWLGQAEEHIADLLILCPEVLDGGEMRLSVVITESKYVIETALAEKRRESQKQLRDTVRRMRDALFGSPERLDRELWLSRFSDLLLTGIQYTASDTIDLGAFRRAVRDGRCKISIRGYSHVFVSGPSEASECSDFVEVADSDGSFQEVYSRAKTRALVASYAKDASPDKLRGTVVENDRIRRRDFETITEVKRLLDSIPTATEAVVSAKSQREPPRKVAEAIPNAANPTGSAEPVAAGVWAYPIVPQMLATPRMTVQASAAEEEWVKATVLRMRSALQQFQLNSKLLSATLTPNAALLKFQGATNLTVDQVLKKRLEFLTTHGIEIVAVRPEPGVVAVSVARPNREVLHTLDVWRRWAPDSTHGNVKLLIGVREEDSGLLFVSPIDNAPHTLIAGTTGSGKSVLMQNIILAIACTNTPAEARIVLIDPKRGVDYFAFDGLPHLDGGLIDDQATAVAKLNDLVAEMDRRYSVLRQNRVGDIYKLNAKPDATERFPFLWVIHDEFAEWMMTDEYRDTVTNTVNRLGIMARAAGIFLFFAAQRPDADVMPMQLRTNLGNRLVLKVDGEGTSEIALGERNGGAERLLGKGHLAAKLVNVPSIVYGQVPLIDDAELAQLLEGIRRRHS